MITTDSKGRRATPALFALLAASALVGSLFFSVAVVSADGNGTSTECQTDVNVDSSDAGQSQDSVSYTAPEGSIVTGVCIKTGVSEGHMDLMTEDGAGDCYTVEGIGTDTVTVTRSGEPGPNCQGISHIDVVTAQGSESEEESASASASQSEEESASASASQSAEQSVEGGTGTPEQSVQGGTGSPEASMGNGATSAAGSANAIPAIAFAVLAIVSLGGLAAVNLATVRRRR